MKLPHPRIRGMRPGRAGVGLAALGAAITLGLPAVTVAEPKQGSAIPFVSPLSAPPERARPRPPDWMGENMHFKKGYGFEYRRELRMGRTPIELGLQGPVVRKKKSLGLTVEVRF